MDQFEDGLKVQSDNVETDVDFQRSFFTHFVREMKDGFSEHKYYFFRILMFKRNRSFIDFFFHVLEKD